MRQNLRSRASFEATASWAFQEAAKLAGAQLLEPVMAVEVVTQEGASAPSSVT